MAADDLGRQGNDGDPRYLADIGNRSGGTGIYLDDVNILSVHNELDVDHSLYMKGPCQLFCILHQGLLVALSDALGRVNGDTVAGMDTGTLDMLHDTRDQDVGAVADGVHLDLLAHDIFIHQDRMLLGDLVDDADELVDILVADGDLHALAAKNVGGAHQYRITQLVGCLFGLLCCKYSLSLGSGDAALLQDLVKPLSVLGRVHVLGCGS